MKLKLIKTVAGFDTFLREGDQETPVSGGVEVFPGQVLRHRRQPQFEGSAEILYEVDGKPLAPQETGAADIRDDELVVFGEEYDLRTNTECLKKSP